jgi:hypothetical protein
MEVNLSIYEDLGIEPIINAGGTLTTLGGSLMLPEVVEAMAQASRAFVPMHELHLAAGRRIAEWTGVEAAHVCAGAAAGIALMAAACMAGADADRIRQLPDTTGIKSRFVVQRNHRHGYDQALRVAGGTLVEIEADAGELERAVSAPDVAGVFYTFAWNLHGEVLSLPQVAEIAHAHGVPVLVDAAAEVPPVENLWRFCKEGADAVAFSGGKALRGPQSTGLLLGRADLIEACRLNDCRTCGRAASCPTASASRSRTRRSPGTRPPWGSLAWSCASACWRARRASRCRWSTRVHTREGGSPRPRFACTRTRCARGKRWWWRSGPETCCVVRDACGVPSTLLRTRLRISFR